MEPLSNIGEAPPEFRGKKTKDLEYKREQVTFIVTFKEYRFERNRQKNVKFHASPFLLLHFFFLQSLKKISPF